ncbi:sterol desaturase family protein [Paracidovorax wautersii]|uniref:Sterol desaturase/sphingolipid hydroxylase (Fatty acid hydroxylase superfamily) n=1 Tax=Paracidovorax wautersii TaxID=1177982 RepID=A0ABU1IDY6_9BURK|nr:sterol desaturase family protein [Paracidovorax wautersii]MDR6214793.1 sterol desaturase/sphingolipid hydroxylase (fatty acid hydroxylase superfamily) [Paracidovorax wautersii]
MDRMLAIFDGVQQWLFESVFQPVLFWLGLANVLEDAYDATGWLVVGVLQLLVMLLLIAPLQRWRPVEAVTDPKAIRVDILYTLIHRLGVFRLVLFFAVTPLWDGLFGFLRVHGLSTFHLDEIWPGVTDIPWVSLLIYLVVFDLLDYWIHRGQHHFEWWWRLHSLHHSQRQMTMWSDNRNHLLDDLLRDLIVVTVAQLIGVAPGQFVAIVALTQLSENFHHANVRLWFGRWGERLWVSPRFHRRHHTIGIGHEAPSTRHTMGAQVASLSEPVRAGPAHAERPPVLGGNNFGVLLPWWDMLFGTANFELRYEPTGVRDQVEPGPDGRVRDYGSGFWSQQWRGLLRLWGHG